MRLLAALFLVLPLAACNDYNISEVSPDDDDVSRPDDTDDESPWSPSFNPHVPDVNTDPDPEPGPEWGARFLVLDKNEFGIGDERYRNIFTIDEDANIINSIGLLEPRSIAFDTEHGLLLAISAPPTGDPRVVTAGPLGFVSDVVIPIVPRHLDFAHPYIVARSEDGMVVFQNVLTGDNTLSYPVDRDWISNAFKIGSLPGVGMFDAESGCIIKIEPESDVSSDHLCDIDFATTSAFGADDSGNIYVGHEGGWIHVHRATGEPPGGYFLPSTHHVLKIAAKDEGAVWVYTSETTASSDGYRLYTVGVDGSIDEIFHVIPEPWTDLEVID